MGAGGQLRAQERDGRRGGAVVVVSLAIARRPRQSEAEKRPCGPVAMRRAHHGSTDKSDIIVPPLIHTAGRLRDALLFWSPHMRGSQRLLVGALFEEEKPSFILIIFHYASSSKLLC
ncbi:unnamed protein product [Heligmosomoides polygyrus]|uniref:Uncharacterized protein n=1 Tax=Heligmosomoides polygyrus TaxID=6339 RepID=A0A183FW90_HELPZ|nr:unnamed protein product [Heligmosomoides polygyrus]